MGAERKRQPSFDFWQQAGAFAPRFLAAGLWRDMPPDPSSGLRAARLLSYRLAITNAFPITALAATAFLFLTGV